MPSRDLADCEPQLADAFRAIKAEYESQYPGCVLTPYVTYRSPAEQQAEYAKGRTKPGAVVTNKDGVTTLSKHNFHPSRAIDVMVVIDGKARWNPGLYIPLGPLADKHGLRWGGRWQKPADLDHLELV